MVSTGVCPVHSEGEGWSMSHLPWTPFPDRVTHPTPRKDDLYPSLPPLLVQGEPPPDMLQQEKDGAVVGIAS